MFQNGQPQACPQKDDRAQQNLFGAFGFGSPTSRPFSDPPGCDSQTRGGTAFGFSPTMSSPAFAPVPFVTPEPSHYRAGMRACTKEVPDRFFATPTRTSSVPAPTASYSLFDISPKSFPGAGSQAHSTPRAPTPIPRMKHSSSYAGSESYFSDFSGYSSDTLTPPPAPKKPIPTTKRCINNCPNCKRGLGQPCIFNTTTDGKPSLDPLRAQRTLHTRLLDICTAAARTHLRSCLPPPQITAKLQLADIYGVYGRWDDDTLTVPIPLQHNTTNAIVTCALSSFNTHLASMDLAALLFYIAQLQLRGAADVAVQAEVARTTSARYEVHARLAEMGAELDGGMVLSREVVGEMGHVARFLAWSLGGLETDGRVAEVVEDYWVEAVGGDEDEDE